ncbi:MAG: hypothetical protein P1U68_04825 [Verrucomicrobiales bacterium]|nr:hypothetical protein [Verrucomicrobiales bacterium]
MMKYLFCLVILSFSSIVSRAQETPPLIASSEEATSTEQADQEEASSEAVPEDLDIKVRAAFVFDKIRFNDRQVDPFGLAMDPANMVQPMAMSDQYQDPEETAVISNSTLTNALQTVPITGIYPKRQTIVIGARVFKAGDIFGMKLEELVVRLRFEGIKGTEVYFKDLDTQEMASVEYNALPATFEPITASSPLERGAGIVPMNDLYIVN